MACRVFKREEWVLYLDFHFRRFWGDLNGEGTGFCRIGSWFGDGVDCAVCLSAPVRLFCFILWASSSSPCLCVVSFCRMAELAISFLHIVISLNLKYFHRGWVILPGCFVTVAFWWSSYTLSRSGMFWCWIADLMSVLLRFLWRFDVWGKCTGFFE